MLTGLSSGRQNATEIKAIQSTAAIEIGYENLLRWNGPRTNRSAYTTRRAIGIPMTRIRIICGSEKVRRESELRTVRNVEPNRGDGGRGRESHRTTETRQTEDETQRAHEPDWHEDKRESLSASAIPDSGVKS